LSALETLIIGVLITIVGWIITSFYGFERRRRAIARALILDIQTRIQAWNTIKTFLDHLIDNDIKVGWKIPYTALFQLSEPTPFDVLSLLPVILHYYHFSNILKTYYAFKEAEKLLTSLLRDITIWKEDEHVLSKEDIKYLCAKRDQIVSYISIFKQKEINKLGDLSKNYRGIQGTEGIISTIV